MGPPPGGRVVPRPIVLHEWIDRAQTLVHNLVRVGGAECETIRRAPAVHCQLQRVIVGVAAEFALRNRAVPHERAQQIVGQGLRQAAHDIGRIEARSLIGVAIRLARRPCAVVIGRYSSGVAEPVKFPGSNCAT